MMKSFLSAICVSACALLVFSHCAQTSGSLEGNAIQSALASPTIALTPHIPGWLLEPEHIHILTHKDRESLLRIANSGTARVIPEEYYQDESEGNRNDASQELFYLYASNAQCLGCRIVDGNRVLMDDLDLSDEATVELYQLLKPYYNKMKDAGKPKLKDPATIAEMEKIFAIPTEPSEVKRVLRKMDYTPVRGAPDELPEPAQQPEEVKSF